MNNTPMSPPMGGMNGFSPAVRSVDELRSNAGQTARRRTGSSALKGELSSPRSVGVSGEYDSTSACAKRTFKFSGQLVSSDL